VSALTQLTHEGPHSLVNCSPHVQLQYALGINMGSLGPVWSTSQSRLKQMDSHSLLLDMCKISDRPTQLNDSWLHKSCCSW